MSRIEYQCCVREGENRYDIYGEPAGVVSAKEAAYARLQVKRIKTRLPEKLDYLWRSCQGDIAEQSDLFRLTYAFELARDAGWVYNLLANREWTGRHAVKLNNGIYALRSSIDNGFDANGRVRYPLVVRITGNIEAVTELFATCGWNVRGISEKTDKNNYLAYRENDAFSRLRSGAVW